MSEQHPSEDRPSERGLLGGEPLSRRRFLTGIGAFTSVVVAGQVIDVWGAPGARALAGAASAPKNLGRTLVVVELAGGNDGLNTLVPHADPQYRTLRPTLGVTNPIDLDGQVGLDPNLVKLAARYKAGQVAVVEGVGYPNPNLSHFASMATWWSGDPTAATSTGWLGRYLDAAVGTGDPLAGIVIGLPSAALAGEHSFAVSIADATGLQPRLPGWAESADDLVAAWTKLAPAKADVRTLIGQVDDVIKRTGVARGRLDQILNGVSANGQTIAPATGGQATAGAAAAPDTSSFTLAAALVASSSPPRVVYIHTLGDYDTHQGEAQRHPALMAELDAGIEAFFSSLESHQVADRAVLLTTSEFGRRAAENGSGTDHGTANVHFVVGPKVKGGRYGQPPSLTKLDASGNLAMTVDFRSLYATVLDGWLAGDSAQVLGAHYEALPVF